MFYKPEAEAELKKLITEAGEAHHIYEQQNLGGKSDEGWPLWYAEYLLSHNVAQYFEEELTKEDIAEDLKAAAAGFKENLPKMSWQEYYAKFMIYDYT